MATPFDDDNHFGLGEMRAPLQRAEVVIRRHESHGWTEKVWKIAYGAGYATAVMNPLLMPVIASQDQRLQRVFLAAAKSLDSAAQLMGSGTLNVGQHLIQGIVPMLGDLAKWAGGGALIGGLIGSVGGLGVADAATIPGGILFGFEAGLMIGGFWGLKDILMEAGKRLDTFINYAIDAAELAWYAGEDRAVAVEHDLNDAAKLFAVAISELWWVVLQALILWVLKRAGELGAKAAGGAIEGTALEQALREAKTKSAQFGHGFGDWFEQNFDKIKKAVDQREKVLKGLKEGDKGGAPEQEAPKKPTPQATPEKPPARSWSYQPKQTGRLEPGAVPETPAYIDQIEVANARTAPPTPEGWPVLTGRTAQTFGSDPTPETLAPGTTLYRVIGKDADASGSFWSTSPPPASEGQWRAGSAVLDDWNGDGGYVKQTVSDAGLNVWSGPAAPQPLPENPGFVLPGGDNQVWVPRGTISGDATPQPTPWNH